MGELRSRDGNSRPWWEHADWGRAAPGRSGEADDPAIDGDDEQLRAILRAVRYRVPTITATQVVHSLAKGDGRLMQLASFSISGFRSLAEVTPIPVRSPTVLTGRNDSGKSSVLDALGFLLASQEVADSDFPHCVGGDG